MCAVISSRSRASGFGSRPSASALEVASGKFMGATLARPPAAGHGRFRRLVVAQPCIGLHSQLSALIRVGAGGVEAVAVVEVEDRGEVGGVDAFDPDGGGLVVLAAEAGGAQTLRDQIDLGVLARARDRDSRARPLDVAADAAARVETP